MAIKYVLSKEEQDAQEQGTLDATAGVQRSSTFQEQTSYIKNSSSLYLQTAGNSTSRKDLLSRINLNGQTFNEYYKSGGYIPSGYKETARALSIEEDRKEMYNQYEAGEIGYEDFLMKAYGKDYLKAEMGIDLTNPLYWYNRVKSGDFSNPLDNDYIYSTVLNAAEELHNEEEWMQEAYTKPLSDTLIAPEIGVQVTAETFAQYFPEMTQAMSEAFDNDINKMLTYYKAGYLNGVFKPYVDTNGDGEYDYVLHTDGQFYRATQDNAKKGEVQINYKKDSLGNYVLDEQGNRIVNSYETRGWFGTSDVGQWFNHFTSGIVTAFTGLVDIFGLAYAGIAGAIDQNKTFGDYYAGYEALKNSKVWRSIENADTQVYDAGQVSTSLQIASGLGTVLEIVGEVAVGVVLAVVTAPAGGAAGWAYFAGIAGKETGEAALIAGIKESMEAVGAQVGKQVTKEMAEAIAKKAGKEVGEAIAKQVGKEFTEEMVQQLAKEGTEAIAKQALKASSKAIFTKTVLGATAGAVAGAGLASASDADGGGVLLGAVAGAGLGALAGFGLGRMGAKQGIKSITKTVTKEIAEGTGEVAKKTIIQNITSGIKTGAKTIFKYSVKEPLRFSWKLSRHFRGGTGMIVSGSKMTARAVLARGAESALMLAMRDGLESFAMLQAGNRVQEYIYDSTDGAQGNPMTFGDMIGKSLATAGMSFAVSFLLRAGQNTTMTSRFTAAKALVTGMDDFQFQAALRQSLQRTGLLGYNVVNSFADVAENFITAGIGSWGRDASGQSMLKHIGNQFSNPTMILMSAYIAANNHGLFRKINGNTSLRADSEIAIAGNAIRMQTEVMDNFDAGLREAIKFLDDETADYVFDEILVKTKEEVLNEMNESSEATSELTIMLKIKDAMSKKLKEIVGEEKATIIYDAFITVYKNNIDRLKDITNSEARNQKALYKRIIKELEAAKNTSSTLDPFDAVLRGYFGHNALENKKANYKALMDQIEADYKAYETTIHNIRTNKVNPDEALDENTKKTFNSIMKEFFKNVGAKLKGSTDTPTKWLGEVLENQEVLGVLPEYLEEAFEHAKIALFRYQAEDILGIKDQELEDLFNSDKYFTSGSLRGSIEEKENPDGTTTKVYTRNPVLDAICKVPENVELLKEYGIIYADEDGQITTRFSESVFLHFNKAQLNEARSNPKLKRLLNILQAMAELSLSDSGFDYDIPLVLPMTRKYTGDKGVEQEETVYIISGMSDIDLIHKMNVVPTVLQSIYNICESNDVTKVSRALQLLGLCKSQDTSQVTLADLTEEDMKAMKMEGLGVMMQFFNIAGEGDDVHNLVNRSRLLQLFMPYEVNGKQEQILSKELLLDMIKDLNNDKTEFTNKEKVLTNLNDLVLYIELVEEAKDLSAILTRWQQNPNEKQNPEDIQKVKAFIIKARGDSNLTKEAKNIGTSPIFKALVEDGVFTKDFETFIKTAKVKRTSKGNFQTRQEATGEIDIQVLDQISQHLKSTLNDDLGENELKEFALNVYNSFIKEEFEEVTYKQPKTINKKIKAFDNKVSSSRNVFNKKLGKKDAAIANDYFTLVLKNPETLIEGTEAYSRGEELLNKLPETSRASVQSLVKKQRDELDKEFLSLFQVTRTSVGAALSEKHYMTSKATNFLYNIYRSSEPDSISKFADVTKDTFAEKFQTNENGLRDFMIAKFASGEIANFVKTSKTNIKNLIYEAAKAMLELKYAEGTVDVMPSYIVKVDLSEFASKGFLEASKKLNEAARLAATLGKELEFDDDLKATLKGLTPYEQAYIAEYLMRGDYILTFDLRTNIGKQEFNKFMSRTGHGDDASTYKPEVAGVYYNDSLERGVEIELTLDGKKVSTQEVLKHISDNIEVTTHSSKPEDAEENMIIRLDALAQNVVYITDDTKINNPIKLFELPPEGNIKTSDTVEGNLTQKLGTKQGVSASVLANYIQRIINTYGVDADIDSNIVVALKAYSVIQTLGDYYFEGNVNPTPIVQTITPDMKPYIEATLKDSPVWEYRFIDDSVEILVNKNIKSAKDFEEALLKHIDNEEGVINFQKILPIFNLIEHEETYSSLTKGGTDFAQLTDSGHITTPSVRVMSQCNITFAELKDLLSSTQNCNLKLDGFDSENMKGMTVGELRSKYANSERCLEKILVKLLELGKYECDAQLNNTNLSLPTNAKKVLLDFESRRIIGVALNKSKGNLEEALQIIKDTPYIIDRNYEQSKSVNFFNINGDGLKLLNLSSEDVIEGLKNLTLEELSSIQELLNNNTISNPKQVIHGSIKTNPLLNAYRALDIVNGNLVIRLDKLHKVTPEAIQALEEIGVKITTDISKFTEAYSNIEEPLDLEHKLLARAENQASFSTTTYGFEKSLEVLTQLSINRALSKKSRIYGKASDIISNVDDYENNPLMQAYVAKLNSTAMRYSNNYGSLQINNLDTKEGLENFLMSVLNGVKSLDNLRVTRMNDKGEAIEVTLIDKKDLYKVSEALTLFTSGTDYSSEYANTFIYNRAYIDENGNEVPSSIKPFSQTYRDDLHFYKQLLSEQVLEKGMKNYVLIRCNKNSLIDITKPTSSISLKDLGDAEVINNLRIDAIRSGLEDFELRYSNKPEVLDLSTEAEKLAYVYSRVVTKKDLYDNIVEPIKTLRFNGKELPEGVLDVLYPVIEHIQVASPDFNLSEEAMATYLHYNLNGNLGDTVSNDELKILNDILIYGITYSKLPEDIKQTITKIKNKVINKDSHEYKFVKAYLNNDVEQMKLQANSFNKEQRADAIKKITYYLMLERLQGKDLNALFMHNKTFNSILKDYYSNKNGAEEIIIDGENLTNKVQQDFILYDIESAYSIASSKDNKFKGSYPTELAFVIGTEGNDSLVNRAKSGKKISIYIKYDDLNISIKPKENEDPEGIYYTTQEAYDNYMSMISKGEGRYTKDNEIIYVVNSNSIHLIQSELKKDFDGANFDNIISFNGKNYDDIVINPLLENLGFASTFKSTMDLYEIMLSKVYSTLTDSEVSLALESLGKKINVKDIIGEGVQHSGAYDALVTAAVFDKFLEQIPSRIEFLSRLGYDINKIASQFFGEGANPEEVKDFLLNIKDTNFQEDLQKYPSLDSYYIKDYQDYGDNFSNEVFQQVRVAYNELMNKLSAKTFYGQFETLRKSIAGNELEFYTRLHSKEHRQASTNTLTRVLNLVAQLKGFTIDIATFKSDDYLKFDPNTENASGLLMDVASILKKVIELNAPTEKQFYETSQKFMLMSEEEQTQLIKTTILNNKDKFFFAKETAIDNNKFIEHINNFENIEPIKEKNFFNKFNALFFQGTDSSATKLQEIQDKTALLWSMYYSIDKLNNTFDFVPEEFRDIIRESSVMFFGQTPEQKTNQALGKQHYLLDSYYNQTLAGEHGDTLGQHIFTDFSKRLKTATHYTKVQELPCNKFDEGVLYLSKENFERMFGTDYKTVAKTVFGDENGTVYLQINRHPSYKQDVLHIIPVKINTSKNAAPIGMTRTTQYYYHMGDFDGDGNSTTYTFDIMKYGAKLHKVTSVPLNILNFATSLSDSRVPAKLNATSRTKLIKNFETQLIGLYKQANDLYSTEDFNEGLAKLRLNIENLKSSVKAFAKDNNIEDSEAALFLKYYGLHEVETREIDATDTLPKFYTHSDFADPDSIIALNGTRFKQESSLFFDSLKIRDQAGYLQKNVITQGERIDVTESKRPTVYTPMVIDDETSKRIHSMFKKESNRTTLVNNLSTYIESLSEYGSFNKAKDLLSRINDFEDDGSKFMELFIRYIQSDLTASSAYKDAIINAYKESNGTEQELKTELDYYHKLIELGKGRNYNPKQDDVLTPEQEESISLFDLQTINSRLLDDILKLNKVYGEGATFQGSNKGTMETLMFNIIKGNFANSKTSNVVYCNTLGDTFVQEGDNATYVNSNKMKILISDRVPVESIAVTSRGGKTNISQLATFEIPKAYNVQKILLQDYKHDNIIKEPRIHTGDSTLNFSGKVAGMFDAKGKYISPDEAIKNPSSVRYVTMSSIIPLNYHDGVSTLKVAITGSGMGKGLLTSDFESLGIQDLDSEDYDLIMHPDMFNQIKYQASSGVLNNLTIDDNNTVSDVPISVVENTLQWSKNKKLAPRDLVTITNGRTAAEGMLAVGTSAYHVTEDGHFVYDTTNVAKIAELQRNAFSPDYNNTNAASLYNFLRLSSLISFIPEDKWSYPFSKEDFLRSQYNNTSLGSSKTLDLINTLYYQFIVNGKLQAQWDEHIKKSNTLTTLWSEETLNNFSQNKLTSINPTNNGTKHKQHAYRDAQLKYYSKASVGGDFSKALEHESSGYHDETFGHYDMLSFINDLLDSNGLSKLTKEQAMKGIHHGITNVEEQVEGSMPNGFNAISKYDATVQPMSILSHTGTLKTDFSSSASPSQVIQGGNAILSPDQIESIYNSRRTVTQREIPLTYNNARIKDIDGTPKHQGNRSLSIAKLMLGTLASDNSLEEFLFHFNSGIRNVQVNTSVKTMIGRDGEARVTLMPKNQNVDITKLGTLDKTNNPTTYYINQEKRKEQLLSSTNQVATKETIQESDVINKDTTSDKITHYLTESNRLLKSFLDQVQNKDIINMNAFEETVQYKTITEYSEAFSKDISGLYSPEIEHKLRELYNIIDIEKPLRYNKFGLSSSGIKLDTMEAHQVDSIISSLKPFLDSTKQNLAGNELKALVSLYTSKGQEEAYKQLNNYLYARLYIEKLREVSNRLSSPNVSQKGLLEKEKTKVLEFFKYNFNISNDDEKIVISEVTTLLNRFERHSPDVIISINNLLSRINNYAYEINLKRGRAYQGVHSLLLDPLVYNNKSYTADSKIQFLDIAKILNANSSDNVDILNVIGNSISKLSREAALLKYTEELKQLGRMSNIPVLEQVNQISDIVLEEFSKIDFKSGNLDYSLLEVLRTEALPYIGHIPTGKTAGETLTTLYSILYDSIYNKENVLSYSELVQQYKLNPNDQNIIDELSQRQLLENVMAFMLKTTTSNDGIHTKVQEEFTTKIFDSFMNSDIMKSGDFILVDANGRPYYSIDKKGKISFDYEGSYTPFLNVEDFVLHAVKYNKELIAGADEAQAIKEIKFNIVTAMLNGDAYIMDKAVADSVKTLHIHATKYDGIPQPIVKQFLQKSRSILSSLIMSNPFKFIDRMVAQYVFDYGTLGKNDLNTFNNIGAARRDMAQYSASKGKVCSDALQLFIKVSGFNLGSKEIAGEHGAEAINLGYFKFTADAFNIQHFETRYAAFLSLYDAAMSNGGNIPAHKAGNAYYKLDAINNYNPKIAGMSEQENLEYNTARKCMAIISEAIGTSGDMPHAAKGLSEYGAMFTSFKLAALRGGLGKLRSLGKAAFDAFTSSNASGARKYLMAQLGNSLAVYGAHAILMILLSSELSDAIQSFFEDPDDEEKEKEFKDMANKYFLNGATIKPFESLLSGETVVSEYQQRDLSGVLYNMFIDPYYTALSDDKEETNIGTATWRLLMENIWSHIPAIPKDIVESIPSNNIFQSMDNVYNEDKSFIENFLRKLGGYTIGNSGTTAFADSYKADNYEDKTFLEKVGTGMNKAFQASVANNKEDKSRWKTYTNARKIVDEYKDVYQKDSSFDLETYSELSSKINLVLKEGKSEQALYNLLKEYLNKGIDLKVLRYAVRNASIQYKISKIDQDHMLNTLTDAELSILRNAIAYEKSVFPFLQDAIDYVEALYNDEYKTYTNNYKYRNRLQGMKGLYTYNTYNNFSNYNNYNRYYKPYTIYNNRFYYNDSQSPYDLFNSLENNRAYQQRQYEYARQRKEWYN